MIHEKLISSIENPNGTTSAKYTARNINIMFVLTIVIWFSIIGWAFAFFTPPSMYEDCIKTYEDDVSSVNSANKLIQKSCIEGNEDNPHGVNDCMSNSLVDMPVNSCDNSWTWRIFVDEPPENNLRKRFGLEDCRATNDFHRLGKYNLEWTAYDIACEPWETFFVKSPWDYTIEKIWYWNNLWDYIILVKWDIRIVLWHIVTSRHIWEELVQWDIIWTSNISWASTWIHIHIELWDWYDNVSREFALWEKYRTINWTALLNHRQWDFGQKENLYDKVMELECRGGFQLEAEWDFSQYSIGCGTKSFKWEKISEDEAYDRFVKEVDRRHAIVLKTYFNLNENQKIALTSLLFNNPECYNHFKNSWKIDMDVWKNKCNKAGGEVLRWLQIRRDKEIELFNS